MQDDMERSTKEVIETLGEDCRRCHEELINSFDNGMLRPDGSVDADYEYHARQLIRAIFAYIEAVTFSVKAWSANYCMEHKIEITPQERYFAIDMDFELNEKGEVVESIAKISLARNIRFALNLRRKARGITEPFDASVEWWSCLKKAIKVRDRLMHPKMPGDLDVLGEDILNALQAQQGFEREIVNIDNDA